jgi:predicted dehydrogenase
MHWDLFCGPTPRRPYHWRLWLKDQRAWQGQLWRGWDMWRDYSGHLMTNWGAHAVDVVQWALGMDRAGPVEFEPLIGQHTGPMRQCPVVARFANGTQLRMTHPTGYNAGACFYGERGRVIIERNSFKTYPRDLIEQRPDPDDSALWEGPGYVARPHLQNWLDCVRSRREPTAPVEVGHSAAATCHLAGIARELRRKLSWDPAKETFPEDENACELLDRPRRAGWELPGVTRAEVGVME